MARKTDEYQPVDFYAEHSKARQSGFAKFDVDGDYYFCRYVDGDIALISQAYTAAAGRDNGIDSVKRNEKMAARYRFEERPGGKHGFSLTAGNRQEIGISPDYDTEDGAKHVTARIRGTAKKATAPAKKKAAPKKAAAKKSAKAATTAGATAFTAADGRRGNYRPLAFYTDHGGQTADGFDTFDHDGAYYFSYRKDGDVRLISEAYTTARARANGVASVEKNMSDAKRYKYRTHENGKRYFDLVAGNNQEIATSPWYDDEDTSQSMAADLRGETVAKSGSDQDDYKPLAFYEAGSTATEDGFDTFTGEDGLNYFVYRRDGRIELVSEGYPTVAALKTGMTSVETNMPIEKRYDYRYGGLDDAPGYRLRAGNNREIARSVPYADESAAMAGAALLLGGGVVSVGGSGDHDDYRDFAFYQDNTTAGEDGFQAFQGDDGLHYFVYRQNGEIELVSEGYATAAARKTGMESVEKNMRIQDRYDDSQGGLGGATGYRLKAGNNREIARSAPHESSAAALAAASLLLGGGAALAAGSSAEAAPEPEAEPIDDYLASEAYEGRPLTDPENGVALFQHENGLYYFALNDADGNLEWRSEGFGTQAGRDEELAIALRVRDNPDAIKRMERNGRYIDMLHDETGREVGRSPLGVIGAAAGLGAAGLAAGALAGTAAAAAPVDPDPVAPAPVAAAPLAAPAETGGASLWGWLKWLLLALLALLFLWLLSRCFGGDADAPVVAPVPEPTPVTCWNGTEADTEAACPARVECADGSFATALDLCPVVATPEPAPVTQVTCWDGSMAATLGACPVEPAPQVTCWDGSLADRQAACPAEPAPQVTCWDGSQADRRADCPDRPAPTPTSSATTAAAGAGAAALGFFDGPSGLTPKTIRRLGTFPEFGDSHDLDPAGFYAKLSDRYDTVDYDRVYLDNLFRAIGYEGGFRDARVNETLFSNTEIDRGTLGILGFAEYHGIEYVNLDPISDRDRQAFRIEAANGRTVYFMKTCGNYFFPVEL